MRRNQRLFLVLSVLVCAAFLMPSGAFAKDKTKLLRLVVPTPPNEYPLSTGLDEMAQKFNARAQGEYKIEVFAGGALVKMPEYFDALRIGAVEIGSVAWTIFAFLDPRLGVIETPFLFNNNEAATFMLPRIWCRFMMRFFSKSSIPRRWGSMQSVPESF